MAGIGLSEGYLFAKESTDLKFVEKEFKFQDTSKKERLYRTGDLGMYRSDGCILFLGRKDYQIKIRGHRMELPEIEHALDRHPSVEQSVALKIPGQEQLIAVIQTQDEEMKPATMFNFAKSELPSFMVPSLYLFTSNLPTSPNKKIDRKAVQQVLPILLSKHKVNNVFITCLINFKLNEEIKNLSETEKTVLEAFYASIDVKDSIIEIEDDFFSIGGHSLLLFKLSREVEKRTGYKIPIATLFKNPTVSKIATLIEQYVKSVQ